MGGWEIVSETAGIRCTCGDWFEGEGPGAWERMLDAWRSHRESCTAPAWSGRLQRAAPDA
jgi:hypothetical protein